MKNLICLMALVAFASLPIRASALPHCTNSYSCVEYYFKKQVAGIGNIFKKDNKQITVEGSVSIIDEKRAIVVGEVVGRVKKSSDDTDSFMFHIPRNLRNNILECDDADVVIKKGFGKNLNLKSFTCHD